jgi:hypothetical protein
LSLSLLPPLRMAPGSSFLLTSRTEANPKNFPLQNCSLRHARIPPPLLTRRPGAALLHSALVQVPAHSRRA